MEEPTAEDTVDEAVEEILKKFVKKTLLKKPSTNNYRIHSGGTSRDRSRRRRQQSKSASKNQPSRVIEGAIKETAEEIVEEPAVDEVDEDK